MATPDLIVGAAACIVATACWRDAPSPVPPRATPLMTEKRELALRRDIGGSWLENFGGRGGCSDTTTIVARGASLAVQGVDCNDNTSYTFDDVSYDGQRLSLLLAVPATGYTVRYELRWAGDDELAGEAIVSGGGAASTYPVTSSRQR